MKTETGHVYDGPDDDEIIASLIPNWPPYTSNTSPVTPKPTQPRLQ